MLHGMMATDSQYTALNTLLLHLQLPDKHTVVAHKHPHFLQSLLVRRSTGQNGGQFGTNAREADHNATHPYTECHTLPHHMCTCLAVAVACSQMKQLQFKKAVWPGCRANQSPIIGLYLTTTKPSATPTKATHYSALTPRTQGLRQSHGSLSYD
jgi:hypothetical protein